MSNRKYRFGEFKSNTILEIPYEAELKELAEIASIMFDVPYCLITILDDKYQWSNVSYGLSLTENKLEDSFCQYAINNPKEVLVINDLFKN